MKNTILTLCFILMSLGTHGQYFDKQSNWTIITTNTLDKNFTRIDTYRVDGDTLFNGKNYWKVNLNNFFYCAVRVSGDNNVFAYYPDRNEELLVYDFNWVIGKELKFQASEENGEYFTYYSEIKEIDSLQLLDNKYYKYIKSDNNIYCIQGLGDLDGFFSFVISRPTNGDQTALLCFYKGEQLIYSNPRYSNCSVTVLQNTDIANSEPGIKIYPQPSKGGITVELVGSQFDGAESIRIYSQNGSLVGSMKIDSTRQIDLNVASSGVFIYQISDQKGKVVSGKMYLNIQKSDK